VAGPGGNAPRVTGDQVRDTLFWPPCGNRTGYDQQEADDLVRRVAAELDARRPAGPVIENATLRKRARGRRYDIDAVDWFLGQFLLPPGHVELAGIDADPWRDLAVARLDLGGVSGPAQNAWRDFDQLPGTYLFWGRAGRHTKELRTAEQETLVFARRETLQERLVSGRRETFSTAGRSFTLTTVSASRLPGVAELSARAARAHRGQFADRGQGARLEKRLWQRHEGQFWEQFEDRPRHLVDEMGTPILYTTGSNFAGRACAWIMFPDQRWLRFPVRGTELADTIMTAVDQAGNRIARYRIVRKGGRQITLFSMSDSVEIIVHPGWKLTDELTLALAISSRWLWSYFETPGGG
jgi:hypothetical protein